MLTHSPEEAADILDELSTDHRGRRTSNFALELLNAVQADLLLASGRPQRARVLLEEASAGGPSALAQSRLLLRSDVVAARRRALDAAASHTLGPRLNAESLLSISIASSRLGLPVEARRLMSRLAAALKRKGNASVLRLAPRSELLDSLSPEHADLIVQVQALPDDRESAIGQFLALTAAERRVLSELAHQTGPRELAERLFLSQNTVKTHLRSIYRKLGTSDNASAVAIANRHGLLD